MRKDDIKALVVGVIEEYGTNDPFTIAELLELHVLLHDLPISVQAYRLDDVIVLNKLISYDESKCMLAHEIGHYLLHGPEVTLERFIKNKLMIKEKMEKEADYFASELLLSNIDDYVIEGLTCTQLSILLSVPEKYVKYKLAK